jgi:nucleoside-diphosphate-sugar epimerase
VNVLILGCGYTGQRVAARFLARGANVIGTHRDSDIRQAVTPGVLVLHSVPPPANVLDALGDAPSRVVYLSTTGVYGSAQFVDENTPVDPSSERARLRLAEEQRVAAGPWSSLILRPAAIYGPGRGIHERVLQGEPCEIGDNFISRIHVEDLAAHVEAGLLSDVTGAYPVADDEPCTSREIVEFCAARAGYQPAPPDQSVFVGQAGSLPLGRGTDRRVDGSAIRRLLGITLQYPSYKVGIPAALKQQPLHRP